MRFLRTLVGHWICRIFFLLTLLFLDMWLFFTPSTVQKIQDSETLDKLFADLDQNKDLEIDFQEFIALIAMVTSACHELFVPNKHDF